MESLMLSGSCDLHIDVTKSLSLQHYSRQFSNTAAHSEGHLLPSPKPWLLLPFPSLSNTQLLGFVATYRSTTLILVSLGTSFPIGICSSQQSSGKGMWSFLLSLMRPITVSSVLCGVGGLFSSICNRVLLISLSGHEVVP